VFVILSNVFNTYTPVLIRELINSIKAEIDKPNKSYEIVWDITFKFVIIYVLFTLASAFFTFLMRQTIVVASRKIEFDLKNDLYNHYQKLDINFFKRYQTGDLMSRIGEDVGKLREFIGPALMYSVNLFTKLTITIYLMYQVHPMLTLYTLIPLPFLSVFIFILNNKLYFNNLKLQQKLAKLTSISQETYSGIRIIKSFTQEKKQFETFQDNSASYKEQALKIVKIESFFQPSVTFLMTLSVIIAIFKGGQLLIDGEINIGNLTEFLLYVNMLTWPVMSIGWVATMIQRANASMSRLKEIFDHPEEDKQIGKSLTIDDLRGDIEFKNVSFRYPETGILALDQVNFKIPYGQRWLIVGKTGSGKSTIAELLMKFYTVQTGEIFINGHKINEIPLGILRKSFAYVPQEVFLFSDTVARNISFGNGDFSKEDIALAAKRAQIDLEIAQFPQKYETVVGERGVTLSGGQKQRISIARGMIHQSPVYLFDDCLSAVDVETEQKLIDALNEANHDATSILITHRIFNQLAFDQVICLLNGKIVEMGSHQELIQNKGLYNELYEKQALR
jgi:ATP-binding cassette subfamily B protein